MTPDLHPAPDTDRRRHPRRADVRPCKLRDRRGLLFVSGTTDNVSEGGALLRTTAHRAFGPGDEVDVVVAWSNEALVPAEEIRRARVRRVRPAGRR